jgi:hypothetical protein
MYPWRFFVLKQRLLCNRHAIQQRNSELTASRGVCHVTISLIFGWRSCLAFGRTQRERPTHIGLRFFDAGYGIEQHKQPSFTSDV